MAKYEIVEGYNIDGKEKTGRLGLLIERENLKAIIGVNSWYEERDEIQVTDMRYAGFSDGDSTGEAAIRPDSNKIHILHGVIIEIPEDVMDKFVKEIKNRKSLENNY